MRTALFLSLSLLCPTAMARAWWDDYPRIIQTDDLELARARHANVMLSSARRDPGWGTFGQMADARPELARRIRLAGLRNLGYYETFGTSVAFVAELPRSASPERPGWAATHWNWQDYGGGPIVWVGAHSFFDDEPFARPLTRDHARYGAPPMRYPDGSVATGSIDDSTDPRLHRVYDAGCAKNVLGVLECDINYHEAVATASPPAPGLLFIPATGRFSGHLELPKDSACPYWIAYASASVFMAAEAGLDGIWSDNFGAWDSFGMPPVRRAFGEWSVARFRHDLAQRWSPAELEVMGATDPFEFDVRQALRERARRFGWDGRSLEHAAWLDPRWRDDPLWRAYLIFKRRTGSAALTAYDKAVKEAADRAGAADFLLAGNDIPVYSLGWPRGVPDLVSTEVSAGWNLCSGPRGFGLPPRGRLAPFYKLARVHARSRLVNVWLYRDGHEAALARPGATSALYYEMLASHALPMLHPGNSRVAGTPGSDAAFFRFVAECAPLYGARRAVANVGLYYSSSSILATLTPGGFQNHAAQPHQFAFWGWGTALEELHTPYRALPEWGLTQAALAELRLLIIPEAEVFPLRPVRETLLPWLRSGGRLIATGRSGMRLDEDWNFEPVREGSTLRALTGVADPEDVAVGRLRRVGRGAVLYLRANLGMEYFLAGEERAELLRGLDSALAEVLAEAPPGWIADAGRVPAGVSLTPYHDPAAGRLFVDVCNHDLDLDRDVVVPTPPLAFSLRLPREMQGRSLAARAVAPDSTPTVWVETRQGRAQLRISPVRQYAGIILEAE